VDNAIGPVISGTPVATGTLTANTTFTLTVTNSANISVTAQASLTVVAVPLRPVITSPAAVAAGATGLTASVPAQTGCTYAWTILGGTLTAGGATNQITFTAGASGTVELGCVVTSSLGADSPKGVATCAIQGMPALPVILVAPNVTAGATGLSASVLAQPGCTYAWTITNGTITAGGATNQITFTAGASGTVQLGCVVTNSMGMDSLKGAASCAIQALPTLPAILVQPNVTAGAAGLSASVAVQAGCTYAWTITNGTITAGGTTNQITFTAGATGTVQLGCVVTNSLGADGPKGVASCAIMAMPAMPAILVQPNVTAGATGLSASVVVQPGCTYAWTITNGTITAGGTTNQITFTAGASGTVQLGCVVTNSLGVDGPKGVASCAIVATPTLPVILVQPNATTGATGLSASVVVQPGCTYAWTITNGTITAGGTTNQITFTAGASGTLQLGCVVTNSLGADSPKGVASCAIQPLPNTPVITVAPNATAGATGLSASVVAQPGSTYAWTIANGTITAGGATNQITFTAGTPGAIDLTATVTNAAGTPVTSAQQVTVVAMPTLTGFSASPAVLGTGASTLLTAVFGGGTAVVDNQLGTVTSGLAVPSGTLTASTTFTITVTNPAGTTVTGTTRVLVGSMAVYAGKVSGLGNLNGTGPLARFNEPIGLAVDAAGNLYVADQANNAIRKVSPAGVVTTLAGSGELAGSADGTGSAARFSSPQGMAVDGAGNVYVADTGNHTIRMITPAGVVSTLAGTAGSRGSLDDTGAAARFNGPTGVAVDGGGILYVADQGNNTIRMITPGGVVSTLAGSALVAPGSADGLGALARFSGPTGVAVRGSGDLFVTDTGNNTIRMITPLGQVTTFAGTAGVQGSADNTGALASFSGPSGLTLDGSGNLYVGDYQNSIVRMITPGGVVSTLAGTANIWGNVDATGAAARFYGPTGLAADGTNVIYVADYGNNAIRAITPAGVTTTLAGLGNFIGAVNGTGAAASFNEPYGLAIDGSGTIYVADWDNHLIRKVAAGGIVSTLAGHAGTAGSVDASGTAASFRFPSGVAVDSTGQVIVADTGNNTIRLITTGGQVTTLAGTAGVTGSLDGTGAAASFNAPLGVAVDASGNVYTTDTGNNTIRKITPAGVVTTLAGTAGVIGSADGQGGAASFSSPSAILLGVSGNLYVTDRESNTIRMITPTGLVSTFAGKAGVQGSADGTGPAAAFFGPNNLAMDADGNLYVADLWNSTIRRITPAGEVSTVVGVAGSMGTVPGPLPALISMGWGFAIDPTTGNYFIAVPDVLLKVTF
jgi:sugar lactone lactonase YvrE